MKRSITLILVLLICFSMLFAACAKYSPAADNYAPEPAYDQTAMEGAIINHGSPAGTSSPSSPGDVLPGRKVIRNAVLSVQTLEFDKLLDALDTKLAELGGYVESRSIRNNDYYYYDYRSSNMRRADMVLRIPADRLDEFLNAVDGLGNVTSREEKIDDVTDSYTDTEAKLNSLRTEYDTLLGLLEKADSLDYVITLQDRLTQVRYEMESLEARLMNYDNLVEFSTVTLSINEVERETPVSEESFGQEVSRRFKESVQDVGDGLRTFAAWLFGDSPRILVWLIVLAIPAIIIISAIRRSRTRRERKAEEKAYKTAESAEEKAE